MSDKKKILFVHHCSYIGGGSWCLFEILKCLDRKRFEPQVLLTRKGLLVERIRSLGIPVIVDPKVSTFPVYGERQIAGVLYLLKALCGYPCGFRSFYRHCEQLKPDVVYLNSSAQIFLPWPAKKSGVKNVVFHNREHWEPKGVLRCKLWIRNWMIHRFVDRVLSITECGVRAIGFPEKSIVVRDWPSFDDEREHDFREELGIEKDKFLILLTGGFQKIKGTKDVLDALRCMKVQNEVAVVILGCSPPKTPRWKVIIKRLLGKLSYADEIIEMASNCENVFLLPPTLQVKAWLQACDVLVSPFRMPHASKAALEAQLLERPVVLYDNYEAHEYVKDGSTGVIVPSGDIHSLAAALDDLVSHPEKRVHMGACGKEHVQVHFSKDKSMELLMASFGGK